MCDSEPAESAVRVQETDEPNNPVAEGLASVRTMTAREATAISAIGTAFWYGHVGGRWPGWQSELASATLLLGLSLGVTVAGMVVLMTRDEGVDQ